MQIIKFEHTERPLAADLNAVLTRQLESHPGSSADVSQFDCLSGIAVSSQETLERASEGLAALKDHLAARKKWWEVLVSPWAKAHKHLTTLRGQETARLEVIEKHLVQQITAFQPEEPAPWEDPLPVVTGLRNLPWKAKITDYRKFLLWCLEDDERLLAYMHDKDWLPLVNNKALNIKAGQMATAMNIPGVEAHRGTTIARAS